MAPASPIRTETRTQRLAADIADAIIAGAFAPGEKLDEQMLADRFGVSRTPVREVLRELAAAGLVEMRPRRGAIVAAVDADRLDALFGAIAELEATCARLSAIGMAPIERRRLEALHAAMGEAAARGDEASYAAGNLRFHGLIFEGAHNAVLNEMAAGLRRRLAPFRRPRFDAPGRLARSHAEHAAIVAAIVANDAAAAHAAMLRHIEIIEDAWHNLSTPPSPRP